jgi:hypothetical protein
MARSVPLSRSTLRVGGGSAFFVRHVSVSAIRLTSRRSQPPLALSVPLSRFTLESAVAQLFSLGHKRPFWL